MAERFRKEVLDMYISQGKSDEQICKKFHCTKEQLDEAIDRYCADESKDYHRKIEKNNVRRKKEIAAAEKKAAKRRSKSEPAKITETATEAVETVSEAPDEIVTPMEAVEEAGIAAPAETYEEIKARVEAQRYVVAGLELVLKDISKQYRENYYEMSRKVEALNAVMRSISQLKEDISKLQEKATQIKHEHDTELDKLHHEQQKLAEYLEKLAEASRVEVLVYQDGTFASSLESEGDLEAFFSENAEGIRNVRTDLLQKDFIDELRLKEITQLAKMLILLAKHGERRYEFIFESDELERVYNEHYKI